MPIRLPASMAPPEPPPESDDEEPEPAPSDPRQPLGPAERRGGRYGGWGR
jgi:hypothetical protein